MKIATALHLLNALIDKGMEYPDAEYRAAQKHSLTLADVDELRAAYDADLCPGCGGTCQEERDRCVSANLDRNGKPWALGRPALDR